MHEHLTSGSFVAAAAALPLPDEGMEQQGACVCFYVCVHVVFLMCVLCNVCMSI